MKFRDLDKRLILNRKIGMTLNKYANAKHRNIFYTVKLTDRHTLTEKQGGFHTNQIPNQSDIIYEVKRGLVRCLSHFALRLGCDLCF